MENSRNGMIGCDARRATLDRNERREQQQTARDSHQRDRISPARVGGAHDPVHERDHPEGRAGGAGDVELPAAALGLGEVARGGEHHRDPDRRVDEEPDSPRQPSGEHAADDESDRGGHPGDGGVVGHRARALRPLPEAGL
jgi:hypothetical protein